jgi:hypothetical protein
MDPRIGLMFSIVSNGSIFTKLLWGRRFRVYQRDNAHTESSRVNFEHKK